MGVMVHLRFNPLDYAAWPARWKAPVFHRCNTSFAAVKNLCMQGASFHRCNTSYAACACSPPASARARAPAAARASARARARVWVRSRAARASRARSRRAWERGDLQHDGKNKSSNRPPQRHPTGCQSVRGGGGGWINQHRRSYEFPSRHHLGPSPTRGAPPNLGCVACPRGSCSSPSSSRGSESLGDLELSPRGPESLGDSEPLGEEQAAREPPTPEGAAPRGGNSNLPSCRACVSSSSCPACVSSPFFVFPFGGQKQKQS